MSFLQTTFTAPSGVFTPPSSAHAGSYDGGNFQPVYNPAVLEKYQGSFETLKILQYGSDEWCAQIRAQSVRVSNTDFETYAGELVKLTDQVARFEPDCLLGPLRGAAKPCVTVEVMTRAAFQYEYFNFQRNSEEENQPRIINDLRGILLGRDPGEAVFRINVTDTARGGNGVNTLVKMLAHIKETERQFENQKWIVDLNLLHDESTRTNISNIERVRENRIPGSFEINLNRYPVPNLIVEDFDAALAIDLEWDGQRHLFKPCSEPGQFLYRTGDEVRIIQSENCYLAFEELYSCAITEWLATSPAHEQVGVVWQEYQDKS